MTIETNEAASELAPGKDAAVWVSLARTLLIVVGCRAAASVHVAVASRRTQVLFVDDHVRRGPGAYLRGAAGRGLRI